MTSNQSSIPWAKNKDWGRYRTIIIDLYLNRGRTLEAVGSFMSEEYGFHATPRMYKTRFRKWGVTKYHRPKPRPLEAGRTTGATGPVGISSEADQSSKQSVGTRTHYGSTLSSKHSGTQSVIRSMTPPDFYKLSEDALRFTEVYYSTVRFPNIYPSISDNTMAMAWAPAFAEWAMCLAATRSLFALGYPRRAFLLLDMCCHQYRSLLKSQHPSLADLVITVITYLSRFGASLVDVFLNFAYRMSQIILGTSHPLSILLQTFKGANAENLVHCTGIAAQYYTAGHISVASHPLTMCYGDSYSDQIYHKIFDPECDLLPLQHRLQHFLRRRVQGQPEDQSNILAHVHAIQCRIAWIHFYARRYEEATELILGILRDPLADARVISGSGCHEILYEIAVVEEKHDIALDTLRKAVATSMKGYGYAHCITATKMARLESHLRSRGFLEEAHRMRIDSKFQLEQICNEIRRLRVKDL
ncbi:Clr5 domain-containing protein [Xylaria sp. FL0933]|nr:Clr5 domain-containing protein [Xylaria sp. FL0933]